MSFEDFIRGFGCFLIVFYLLCGLDDSIWYICSLISGFLHRKGRKDDVLSFDTMRNTPPKMLAVTIAAWHEANVIGDVITNFLNTTDYPKSMYHLFVGVYPNDPETIAAVEKVSETFPNVHPIINCKEGPTTKAQNINHVIRQIRKYEEAHVIRFASLTVHDSEDVIHTYGDRGDDHDGDPTGFPGHRTVPCVRYAQRVFRSESIRPCYPGRRHRSGNTWGFRA